MASNDDIPAATVAAPVEPQQQQQRQQQQPEPEPETLVYFAFGSNLSSTQMRSRCPGAEAVGLAFLPGYEFIINERGFANVVPNTTNTATSSSSAAETRTAPAGDARPGGGVYGVLYRLASAGEKARLDGYEGVPWAYEDLVLQVEQLSGSGSGAGSVRALVYADRARVSPSAPRDEYVVRMNTGIREARAEWGLPRWYVREVMRRYIPASDDDNDDGDAGGEEEGV